MRILVISDTHIPVAAKSLPLVIEQEAKQSDCCLHAGDFIGIEVLKQLSCLTKVHGVCGNMDEGEVKKILPAKKIIEFGRIKLALIHGQGGPSRLKDYIHKEFEKEMSCIDIFVFGHSHIPLNEEHDGKLYFNPGSPTDKMFTPYNSYGILEINGEEIKRRIVKIE